MMRDHLFVRYSNGGEVRACVNDAAHGYIAANNMSYSGGKIDRVELVMGGSPRALWDASWDDASKAAGLEMPA